MGWLPSGGLEGLEKADVTPSHARLLQGTEPGPLGVTTRPLLGESFAPRGAPVQRAGGSGLVDLGRLAGLCPPLLLWASSFAWPLPSPGAARSLVPLPHNSKPSCAHTACGFRVAGTQQALISGSQPCGTSPWLTMPTSAPFLSSGAL